MDHRRRRLSEEGRALGWRERQHCGQLGKQDNCQVAVSPSLANHHASLPVAYRLYLPEGWAEDSKRRHKTGVPEDFRLKTVPAITLEQVEAACKAGLLRDVVMVDAGYGCIRIYVPASVRLRCITSPAFCRRRLYGRPAGSRH